MREGGLAGEGDDIGDARIFEVFPETEIDFNLTWGSRVCFGRLGVWFVGAEVGS